MLNDVYKVVLLTSIVFAGTLATIWVFSPINISSESVEVEGHHPRTMATSADIDSTWRHTKFGWQDSVGWPPADSFSPVKSTELLHPFVLAGIVLIAVVAAMIWASSEWEIERLFETDDVPLN